MSKKTVAIIGASPDRSKFGNKSVRAHAARGYDVYPVNVKGGTIEGLAVHRQIGDVPVEHLDRVSVYLPPPVLMTVLDEIAAKGCDELWLNPGTDSDEVISKARSLGLPLRVGCSIVDLGISPAELP